MIAPRWRRTAISTKGVYVISSGLKFPPGKEIGGISHFWMGDSPWRRLFCVLLLLLLGPVTVAAAPDLQILNPHHVFQPVPAGVAVRQPFKIRNNGSTPLELIDVQTD